MELDLNCSSCVAQVCRQEPGTKKPPKRCPAPKQEALLAEVQEAYTDDDATRQLTLAAARTESAGYLRDTRVEETIGFARRLGVDHLGIAHCVGTAQEARMAQEIFEAHGFRVSSIACKVGSISKETVGLSDEEKVRPGQHESMCNPIGQAKLLAAAGAQLNVIMGLCVGHDSLFIQASEVPVTVLMAKDRVTGHNPAAALYLSRSYYRRLREG